MGTKVKEGTARRAEKAEKREDTTERKENTPEQKRKVEKAEKGESTMMNTCTGPFEVKKLCIFALWFYILFNIHNFVFELLHESRVSKFLSHLSRKWPVRVKAKLSLTD